MERNRAKQEKQKRLPAESKPKKIDNIKTRQDKNDRKTTKAPTSKGKLKVIPLGGLNEIGKNLTLLEYKDSIIIIDCGMTFPDDEMYGIDIVLPDFSYLVENKSKIKAMVITHGHEDHIGAIPYLLKEINVPVIYGTKLTVGLIENKLKEHKVKAKLKTVEPGEKLNLKHFKVEIIRTTHSIAGSVCLSIETPVGLVFHTGDFKIDYTPIDGEPLNLQKLAEIGQKGVLLMMSDSTNATRKGYTQSEKNVGTVIENIFRQSTNRIIIATFASSIHRVQKIIDAAVSCNRKVAVSGRSMENVMKLALDLGYIKVPAGTFVDLKQTKGIPDKKLVIITTGSQGEPMSALARMANKEHRSIKIKKGDTVILSSTPIPGNEKTVSNIVNKLFEEGAEVIYSDIADIHVSGHAAEEELKLALSLISPKFFMPVHGEYRHLYQHGVIAEALGIPNKNIFLMENGKVLELTKNSAKVSKKEVESGAVLVDGLGVGDVGNVVLNDRKMLSESGLIIVSCAVDGKSGKVVSGPEILTRGFIYVKENEEFLHDMRKLVLNIIFKAESKDKKSLRSKIIKDLGSYIYKRTKRNPLVLPVIMEV